MQYNVAQLLKESIGATREYGVDEVDTTAGDTAKRVTGKLHLMRTDKGIWASAKLTCEESNVCSRCLVSYTVSRKIRIEEEYVPTIDVNTGQRVTPSGVEDDTFRIDERHTLDLTEAVRQYKIASAPAKPLCREDCAGLCSVCGANLNQGRCGCTAQSSDPRWDALAKLRTRS
jgi:uncharacterized protein